MLLPSFLIYGLAQELETYLVHQFRKNGFRLFRLPIPKKGYKGIKKSFANKGTLGYRGIEINKLIEKMI